MGCPHCKDVAFRVITRFKSPVSPSEGCSYTVGTGSLQDSGHLSPGPLHRLPDLENRAHQPYFPGLLTLLPRVVPCLGNSWLQGSPKVCQT